MRCNSINVMLNSHESNFYRKRIGLRTEPWEHPNTVLINKHFSDKKLTNKFRRYRHASICQNKFLICFIKLQLISIYHTVQFPSVTKLIKRQDLAGIIKSQGLSASELGYDEFNQLGKKPD